MEKDTDIMIAEAFFADFSIEDLHSQPYIINNEEIASLKKVYDRFKEALEFVAEYGTYEIQKKAQEALKGQ